MSDLLKDQKIETRINPETKKKEMRVKGEDFWRIVEEKK